MTVPSTKAVTIYSFVAELYDHVVPYRERPDINFYLEAAQEADGPVLEVGCGTGRVLIPTARAGIEIVGLDLSAHMLGICRDRLGRETAEVQTKASLIEADMRDFDLGRTFKLITIPFRPFQHLTTVTDQIACLTTIRRHLADDGRFILDIFNPHLGRIAAETNPDEEDSRKEFGEEPEFTMPDGRSVIRKHRIVAHDRIQQVNQVELIYYVTHPDGRQERLVQAFPMRYLFRYEAEHLLARCGLQVEQLYADYDKSSFGSKYPGELIMVTRKIS